MEWLQTFDIGVLQWLRETLSTPFMDKLMVLISTLGNAGALWLFLGVLFLIMGIRRKNWREMGILLLLCVGARVGKCTPRYSREKPITAPKIYAAKPQARIIPRDFPSC